MWTPDCPWVRAIISRAGSEMQLSYDSLPGGEG